MGCKAVQKQLELGGLDAFFSCKFVLVFRAVNSRNRPLPCKLTMFSWPPAPDSYVLSNHPFLPTSTYYIPRTLGPRWMIISYDSVMIRVPEVNTSDQQQHSKWFKDVRSLPIDYILFQLLAQPTRTWCRCWCVRSPLTVETFRKGCAAGQWESVFNVCHLAKLQRFFVKHRNSRASRAMLPEVPGEILILAEFKTANERLYFKHAQNFCKQTFPSPSNNRFVSLATHVIHRWEISRQGWNVKRSKARLLASQKRRQIYANIYIYIYHISVYAHHKTNPRHVCSLRCVKIHIPLHGYAAGHLYISNLLSLLGSKRHLGRKHMFRESKPVTRIITSRFIMSLCQYKSPECEECHCLPTISRLLLLEGRSNMRQHSAWTRRDHLVGKCGDFFSWKQKWIQKHAYTVQLFFMCQGGGRAGTTIPVFWFNLSQEVVC